MPAISSTRRRLRYSCYRGVDSQYFACGLTMPPLRVRSMYLDTRQPLLDDFFDGHYNGFYVISRDIFVHNQTGVRGG